MLIVTVPILAVCTFCTVNIMLNIGREISVMYLIISGVSVLLGMTVAFTAAYFTDKISRRHSKYTYFDFLPKGMVFSEYAGEFARYGKKVILRKLYYIPFETLESVSRNPKIAPHDIEFKGEIRGYFFETNRLGYHIFEDGEIVFDNIELNFGRYDELKSVTVKDRFGNTKRLEKAVNYHWNNFKNAPKKKPFNIADYVTTVKKRRPKTSNPMLEAPSYSRDWK
ncbi:MAG: hypothetical protein J1F03_09840 [Oscillospiraceae bacterium]|nr:hypothetical protein [Oscillospiraceae bacterium]